MKRTIAGILVAALAVSLIGCKETEVTETEVSISLTEAEAEKPQGLINHMTDKEKEKTQETELRLLNMAGSDDALKTGICYEVWNPEDYLADLEASKDEMSQEDYDYSYSYIAEHPEEFTNRTIGVIFRGDLEFWFLPSFDFDTCEGHAIINGYNPDSEESSYDDVEFKD